MSKIIKQLFTLIVFCSLLNTAQAHWTSKGPYGGHVTCLYAADTLLYMGSPNGGVYRSTSSAVNAWRYANYTGLTDGFISDIVQQGNTMLATTPSGIFRSTDIGATWALSNTGITSEPLYFLNTGTRILVSTYTGIFKSDDGGNTWVFIAGSPNDPERFATDGTKIFVGTLSSGVYMSTNNGDTWSAVNTGLSSMTVTHLTISGGNLFAATASGMAYTSVSSINWSDINTGLPLSGIYALTSSGGKIYAGTSFGVYTSPDAVPTWTAATSGFTGIVTAISVFNSKIYIGTTSDGVYKSNSTSSISWVSHNNGFNNLDAYAVYNDGLLVIAATDKGLFVSRDLAASYVSANNGLTDSAAVRSMTFAGSDLYVATENGGVFKSSDTGATWTPVNTGLSVLNIQKIHATTTHLVISSATGQVFTSPLSSISWVLVSGLPTLGVQDITSEGSKHVFLATLGSGVYSTTDLITWTNINPGLVMTDISSLAIKGTDIYAGTMGNGIYKSNINTLSWSTVNTGLPTLEITALHSAGQWVVAGYTGGVHATYNDGLNWEPTNVMDYIPEYSHVFEISFTAASTRVFITTPNNSVYSNGVAELPVGINDLENAAMFNISPNPSNGNFTVTLKDIQQNIEGITVVNLEGKEIASIPATKRSVSVNVSLDLAKGFYLVKVNTSAGVHTQKLVIE